MEKNAYAKPGKLSKAGSEGEGMKQYKAIYFDWDGTAVLSRTAPVEDVLKPMIQLLRKGIKLIIISGTTYENIAGGHLHERIPEKCCQNLFLGLGRGAYQYGVGKDGAYLLEENIPDVQKTLRLHELCFQVHSQLLEKHGLRTDIVFSRPNYCKIDLMVENDRKGQLFLQGSEIEQVNRLLAEHGVTGGLYQLITDTQELGKQAGMDIKATTDAKYLEVGFTTKSDNVDFFAEYFEREYGILPEECCFAGDEFTRLSEGIYGSDAQMITEKTKDADFFDVSPSPDQLPERVVSLGGGVERFRTLLEEQI